METAITIQKDFEVKKASTPWTGLLSTILKKGRNEP
jgi:hypothetical protein